jgi:hypothetical protein
VWRDDLQLPQRLGELVMIKLSDVQKRLLQPMQSLLIMPNPLYMHYTNIEKYSACRTLSRGIPWEDLA